MDSLLYLKPVNGSQRLALVALFSALSLATNYAMFSLWNVKLMDTFVFVAGYCLGFFGGSLVAVITWLIYGTLNPLGFNLYILFTVVPSEMIYAWMGSWARGWCPFQDLKLGKFCLSFGVVGLVSTFIYDLTTNMVSGVVFTNTIWPGVYVGLLTMNFPIPMGITHEVSNFFFFALLAPIMILQVERVLQRRSVVVEVRRS